MSDLYTKVGKPMVATMIGLVVLLVIMVTGVWLFVRELPFFR